MSAIAAAPTASEALSHTSLEELMYGYAQGETEAFDCLYERLAPELKRYARRRTLLADRAEDVVQSMFVKLHRARHRYRPGTPLMPWVMTIAKHTLYDYFRSEGRRQEYVTTDGEMPQAVAEDAYGYLEVAQCFERAIEELSPEQREAVELTRLCGLSGEEAALRLNTTPGAIKLRVHRASQALRLAVAA